MISGILISQIMKDLRQSRIFTRAIQSSKTRNDIKEIKVKIRRQLRERQEPKADHLFNLD